MKARDLIMELIAFCDGDLNQDVIIRMVQRSALTSSVNKATEFSINGLTTAGPMNTIALRVEASSARHVDPKHGVT
jgi:hypothetical protein